MRCRCWKHQFPTWWKAEASARRQRRMHGRRVHPYRCRHCRLFHLTSERDHAGEEGGREWDRTAPRRVKGPS